MMFLHLCNHSRGIFFSTLITILFTFNSPAHAEGTISGQIRDRSTKAPIPFAEILIGGCASIKALEDGAYIVDCPSGNEYQIEIRAKGYIKKQTGLFNVQNNSFVQKNILLERQENISPHSDRQTLVEQKSEPRQVEEVDTQLSKKMHRFSKILGKIAADRVAKRLEDEPDGGYEDYPYEPDGGYEDYPYEPDGGDENYPYEPDGGDENYPYEPDGGYEDL